MAIFWLEFHYQAALFVLTRLFIRPAVFVYERLVYGGYMRKYVLFHMHVLLSFAFATSPTSTGVFLCFAPNFNSLSFGGTPLQDLPYTPHSPSFAMPLLQAFSLLHAPFLLSAFTGALPITMTAALLRSFAIPLLRAFSLFFTLLQLFILCRHSVARPVIHAALPVFCHASRAGVLSCACALPVFRRGVTKLRQRSARI